MSTFRRIGARTKTQGGGGFNNLAVTNQITSANPVNIFSNSHLINTVIESLQTFPAFVETLSTTRVRTFIRSQLANAATIAALILPVVVVQLATDESPTGLIATLAIKSAPTFSSAVQALLLVNAIFLYSVVQGMIQYVPTFEGGVPIASNAIAATTKVVDKLAALPDQGVALFQSIFNLVPGYLSDDATFNAAVLNEMMSNTVNLKIPESVLSNGLTVPVHSFNLNKNSVYNIEITKSVFTNSAGGLTRIVLKLLNSSTGALFATLFDETFTAVASKTVAFSSTLTNSTASIVPLVLVVYSEMNSAFVTASLDVTLYNKVTVTNTYTPVVYFIDSFFGAYTLTPMRFTVQNFLTYGKTVSVYDFQKILLQTLPFAKGQLQFGFLQVALGTPIWRTTLLTDSINASAVSVSNGADYNTVLGANITGSITVPVTPTPVTFTWASTATSMLVVNTDSVGVTRWATEIDSNYSYSGGVYTLSTIVASNELRGAIVDSSNNVYGFGNYTCLGNVLRARNANGTYYATIIDNSPLNNPSTSLPNGKNGFIVAFDPSGIVIGSATVKGDYDQIISSVFIERNVMFGTDLIRGKIFVAGVADARSATTVTNLNGSTYTIPALGSVDILPATGLGKRAFVAKLSPIYYVLDFGKPDWVVTWWVAVGSASVGPIDLAALDVVYYNRSMFVLYNMMGTVLLYNVNQTTNPAFQITGTSNSPYLVVAFYEDNLSGGTCSWATTIESSTINFQDKTQICNDNQRSTYSTFSTSSSVSVKTYTAISPVTTVLELPANVLQGTWLLKLNSAGQFVGVLFFSNASSCVMRINSVNFFYVDFVFQDVCTAYTRVNGVLTPSFSIGSLGGTGNGNIQIVGSTFTPKLNAFCLYSDNTS